MSDMNALRKFINVEYDIGVNGFAPDKCETKLHYAFNHYQSLVTLLSTENGDVFRNLVNELELQIEDDIPSTTDLPLSHKKYLYSILSMIVHKYV